MNVVADSLSIKVVLALMKFHDDWKSQLGVEYVKNHLVCYWFDGIIHDDDFKALNDISYLKDRTYLVSE